MKTELMCDVNKPLCLISGFEKNLAKACTSHSVIKPSSSMLVPGDFLWIKLSTSIFISHLIAAI